MENARRKSKVWEIAVIAAIASGIAAYLAFLVRNTGIPVRERLGQFESGKVRARFKMPPSGPFHLVLAIDKAPKVMFDAKTRPTRDGADGYVQVNDGTNVVARFSLAHADLEPCNWLESHGFGVSYIVGWRQTPRLEELLVPGRVYEIEAQSDDLSSTNTSLWISCIVANKDRELASGMKLK